MKDYINRVVLPYIKNKKCLLVLEDFSAHKTESVFQHMTVNKISPKNIRKQHYKYQAATHTVYNLWM
jgi:hypothetical protein